jgi:hypothetical protein
MAWNIAGIAAFVVFCSCTGFLANLDPPIPSFLWGYGIAGVVAAVVGISAFIAGARTELVAARSGEVFREAAEQLVAMVDAEARPGNGIVGTGTSETASRGGIAARGERTDRTEVKDQATEGKAVGRTAALSEADASRIASLIGKTTDERFRGELRNLIAAHDRQIATLRRSGNISAIWTFVAGSVLGFVGNVIVALWLK